MTALLDDCSTIRTAYFDIAEFPDGAHAPGLEIVGAGVEVPLATGGSIEYANLDHGASAPALHAVKNAVDAALERYASVHRGAGYNSQLSTALYEGARQPIREFVGGRADDAVIYTRNTTDSFNLLSHCLPAETTVIVFETEHHAALLPWRGHQVIRLAAPASPAAAVDAIENAVAIVTDGPKLVVVTGASNVTGELWPVAEIVRVAHAGGARVALDAAQLAPHRPFSITDLGADYVALSGHKLYAPYGSGVLVGRADWLAAAPPYLVGGGATATVGDYSTTWKPLPERHEAGTPNVVGVVALATACHVLRQADPYTLADIEAGLTDRLRTELAEIPGVTVHSLWGGTVDSIGVVTFTVASLPANVVAAALSAEWGIGIRDGAFCAQPLVRKLLGDAGCSSADGTGHAARVSIGLGTTGEHVERLLTAVRRLAEFGPALEYTVIDARPQPVDDPRVQPAVVPWA